jgi:predicted HTH transcriptional regulator
VLGLFDSQSLEQAIEASRKQQILEYISKNGKTTSAQIANHITLTQVRIRAILKDLVADGVIEKIGNYRYTSYTMKSKK